MHTKYKLILYALATVFITSSCSKEEIIPEKKDWYGLPVIEIKTDNAEKIVNRETYLEGVIKITNGSEEATELNFLEIKGRGNSTWNFPKRPYQIRFSQKQKVLGMPKGKKWLLLANYTDKTMLRNEVGFELGRISQLDWTPDSRFADLYINEEYLGTYQVTQKVEESSNRVDIGDDGFLLEVDQLDRLDEDDVYFKTVEYLFNIKEPSVVKGDEKYSFIASYLIEFENVLHGENFKDPIHGYNKYIDVDALIDWYLINEIARNNDAVFHSSVFMTLIPGEKLKLGPIWDFDISFGNIDYNGNENTDGFWIKNETWFDRLFQDPVFVEKVKSRFKFFYQNRDIIFQGITTNAERLNDSQTKNYEKWKTLGIYVWPNYVYFDTYKEEVDYLKEWLEDRLDWLDQAFKEM